jgi:cytosine permease
MMTPDITRFAKNKKHVFYIVLMTIFIGEFIINGLAIFLANMLHSADVVKIMSMSTGTLGLVAIILSTIRVNDLNLYSSALGILENFIVFLNVLSYVFPPIISIILVDYYSLRKKISKKYNSFAILTCTLGSFIGGVDYGIPVINSIILTSFLYYISNGFFLKFLHNRKST